MANKLDSLISKPMYLKQSLGLWLLLGTTFLASACDNNHRHSNGSHKQSNNNHKHSDVSWSRQLGTSKEDFSNGVVTDSKDNVYLSGSTKGALAGANQGNSDAWVVKYNSNGNLVWKRQLSTSKEDSSNRVATDSKGNVYLFGYTHGTLAGANQGFPDAWVAKYDSGGNLVWKRQLDTSSRDSFNDVATDSKGNVYLFGPNDAFQCWVAKYDSGGNLVWKRQLGTSKEEFCYGVATDSKDNVYLSGYTHGALAGANQGFADAWVAKYDSGGNLVWKRQLGTSEYDSFYRVATDSKDNVYLSGSTYVFLAGGYQGSDDVWLAKYDSDGNLAWKRQLGTSADEYSNDVATDSKGNIYLCGYTGSTLAGAYQGRIDAWVAEYDSDGNLAWKRQLGTFANDEANGVVIDSKGNIYISGNTEGALAGANQGLSDAWIVKYTP